MIFFAKIMWKVGDRLLKLYETVDEIKIKIFHNW